MNMLPDKGILVNVRKISRVSLSIGHQQLIIIVVLHEAEIYAGNRGRSACVVL